MLRDGSPDALRDYLLVCTRKQRFELAGSMLDQESAIVPKADIGRLASEIRSSLGGVACEIVLVGSGSVGYSLAPKKFPKPFHEGSDLDIAVISPELFDDIWSTLRVWAHPRRESLPGPERSWLDSHTESVFWGWMDVNRLQIESVLKAQYQLKPLRDAQINWFQAFKTAPNAMLDSIVALHDLKGRLYRTRTQLVEYHAESLRRLQLRIKAQESEAL